MYKNIIFKNLNHHLSLERTIYIYNDFTPTLRFCYSYSIKTFIALIKIANQLALS